MKCCDGFPDTTGKVLLRPTEPETLVATHGLRDYGVYCMAMMVPGEPTGSSPVVPMYSCTNGMMGLRLPNALKEFGSYAVVIYDMAEFVDRFDTAAKNRGWRATARPVEYIKKEPFTRLGPFRKLDTFSKHAEYWFFINHQPECPFNLELGSIEDIAGMADMSQSWL